MRKCMQCGSIYDEKAPENAIRKGEVSCPKCGSFILIKANKGEDKKKEQNK